MSLDEKDAKILKLVQQNNRLTAEEIGNEIGLSHTAVARRLKRLREREIIVADVALVSPEAVGYPVRVNISCSVERDYPETYDRFAEALRTDPAVLSADLVMGKADFTFTVVARSMEAYAELLRRYTSAFPTLKNITSLGVLQEIKRGYAVPVAGPRPDETSEA